MRLDLQVPFSEKDEAKALGARWDAARKIWYVENPKDLAAFSRWHNAAKGAATPKAGVSSAGPKLQSAGILIVGSNYVEQPVVCACLPWDSCEKCVPAKPR